MMGVGLGALRVSAARGADDREGREAQIGDLLRVVRSEQTGSPEKPPRLGEKPYPPGFWGVNDRRMWGNGRGRDQDHAAFIWSVADLLRGDYKQSEYGKVILPLTVIRRLDCVLEPTKDAVLAKYKQLAGKVENVETPLQAVAGQQFYNTSPLTFTKLLDDPSNIADSLNLYIGGFSEAAKDVIDKFDFGIQIDRLRKANLLYQVIGKFAEIDLHPEAVSNIEMGYLYEELIRKFSELSNETAGEHFTPREVIRLMVNLLFIDDDATCSPSRASSRRSATRPAGPAGCSRSPRTTCAPSTPQARLEVFGQELNAETYADLPLGHDAQGPGRLAHRLRQLLLRRPPRGRALRLPARQSAVRRGVEEGPGRGPQGGRDQGLQRPLRRGAAAHQRRLVPLPAAHDLQDEAARGGRVARGDRLQRLAALHRRGRVRASRRSAAGSSRTTGWRPSSRCPTSSSTTPASPPTSGS